MIPNKVIAIIAAAVIVQASVIVVVAKVQSDKEPVYRWTNTDIIENVYPEFTETDLKDNFYQWVLTEAYKDIAGCETADEALKKFNEEYSSINIRATQAQVDAITMVMTGQARGPDADVLTNYCRALLVGDHTADFALVQEYLAEIEAMDTEQEFKDFVGTGGKGYFRELYTSKTVMNSKYTGNTSVYVSPGTVPWYEDFEVCDDTEKLQTYKQILELYFSNSPEKASKYYDDFVYASEALYDAYSEESANCTYAELSALCTVYPLQLDFEPYADAGCDTYTVEDTGYLKKLDSLCREDGYRYSRAIAVYGLMMDSALRLGDEYAEIVTGSEEVSGIMYLDVTGKTYGMLVGKYFTQIYGEPIREKMEGYAEDVIEAAGEYFSSLTWISEQTKANIQKKLDNIVVHACGPEGDQWGQYDYSDVLGETDLVAITAGIRQQNESIKIEQSAMDRGKYWTSSFLPQTCNAMYLPSENAMYLLTGYFYGLLEDDISFEVLCQDVLMTIGHEITHGFDSNGSNYDETGKLNEGWLFTESERREYNSRISGLVGFLDGIAVIPGQAHSGKLTNGEITADMGGVAIMLLMASKVKNFDYKVFFANYAKSMAKMYTLEGYKQGVLTNPHPSMLYRTNIVLMQFKEFFDCYGIAEGDNMYLKDSVNPWRV